MRDAELLDAIYASPDDDEPRSVYADWLLERGDPRGEMIALQLARAHAGDPEMSPRERELIRTYQRDWLVWVWDALYPPSVRFARGFLHAASVNARGDRRLAERLTGDRRWRTVRALAVHDTHPHIPLYTHAALADLDELHQVTPELLAALLDAPPRPLRVLGLTYTPMARDAGALALATSFPRLRELELSAHDEPLPDAFAWLWTAPLGARLATLTLRLYQDVPSSAALAAWRTASLPPALATVRLRARERTATLQRGPTEALDQVAIEDHRRD